ncbi:serine/threonine-protein phosphatase 6 regulatory subunit 3-like isoform X1 [Haliotis rubra]|uniref:serine/threonine-protein phosphatase 6 regulatory subunit 3-like isoform X1 n=1 Tax=Haliotis rubra TaxID=36100 RepID=UPI001EE5886E|nr:serine/threonine-protein phosphatase 6 regulatory subunit 3-like isoform X1 [Haliotis rubra]
MFWKFNILTSSHIDSLLDKEDVTLRELMDEDDILQECKAQNRKLIEFIIQPENMEEMVQLITKDPPDDVDEKMRFKPDTLCFRYPNTACEVLTSDVTQINDKLAGDEALIDKLYGFLEGEKPLNPLLASFFSKVMGLLITRKSEMIFEYLKSKKDFVGSLLDHIGTSAIMDLLLRLITCIELPDVRRAVIDWLNDQHVVERLVASIVPSTDEDIHCNAAQSLCDIVRLGREQIIQLQDSSDPDPLLVTMELEETVAQLLKNLLDTEKNESVLVNGLFVIHTLLEVRKQGTEGAADHMAAFDTERLTQGVNSVLAAISPRLKDFHQLLLEPPKQRFCAMPTTCGTLEPPLGNTRLQIAKLVTALVSTNTHSVNVELANLGTTRILLDLYFKYVWNNFLHTQVEQCINTILSIVPVEVENKKENPLLVQLFSDCKIIQRLLDEWEENEQQQAREGGRRRGFMGHLTKMANTLVSSLEKGENAEFVKDCFNETPEESRQRWETFVSGTLAEINKKNTVELIRGHPLASSSEEDDGDFKDIPFPQDTAMQQAFSDYQLQQMTSNFIDQFGFNEEELIEQEEKIDSPFNERISSIDFNIRANEETHPSSTMFEQAAQEKIQQFDDDSEEDIWEEKPISFDKTAQQNRSSRLSGETARHDSSEEDSTDSEEEINSPQRITQCQQAEKMDVDAGWANFDDVPMESGDAMETGASWSQDRWAQPAKAAEENGENWADFSSMPNQFKGRINPRSSSPVAMDTSENTRGSAYVVPHGGNNLEADQKSPHTDLDLEDVENEEQKTDAKSSTPIASSQSPQSSDISQDTPPPPPSTSPPRENNIEESVQSQETSKPTPDKVISEGTSPDKSKQDDSFLATSGLIKSPSPSSPSPQSATQPLATEAVHGNGPTQELNTDNVDTTKVEEARAMAKEALENYNKVVPDSSSSVPNGPV